MGIMESRSEFNRAVWQIRNALMSGGDVNERINAAFEIAMKAAHAGSGAIWLYDRLGSGLITPRFIRGHLDISHVEIKPGEGILGASTQNGTPVNITDFARAEAEIGNIGMGGVSGWGLMVVPLKSDVDAIGCIHLLAEENRGFSEDDFELIDMLSLLCAMEIEKSGMLISHKKWKRLIKLSGVIKTYGEGEMRVKALRGIDLNVNEGEFLVILGKSGCGKTTLLNVIGGMDGFDGGEYVFQDKRIDSADDGFLTDFRRNNVGFIFQHYSLMQDLTARENLSLIAGISENPGDVDKTLEMVGLSDRANNYPSQLSGGQQQRVAIARALVKSPRLVLADEPTAALDEATSKEVLDVFDNLVRKTGITLIIITHNPEIAKMADRVAKMREGRLSEIIVNTHPLKASELTW